MADFKGATQVDLTPKAQAIMQLMMAGMSPFTQPGPQVKFGPGQPILPIQTEVEPRIYQYTPGVNLTMIPRAGFGVLPFESLRAISMACKEVRLNIEHIKRQMRGIEWDISPVKNDPVTVGGSKWVATPDTGAVEQFMKKPDGVNPFDAWLNMLVEEVLVTDALTLYPRYEGRDLAGVDIIDGATIRPLLNQRGAIPTPPSPAYLQVIHGMSMSAWPANVLLYRPLNTKVNSPYGEVGVEWILTTINTAIRYDLSRMGYFTEGNIPGAFYSVPESWTPDQIQVFNDYIDAVFTGDVARAYKLLAVPGGTGSHVTPFQQNDYDKTELNSYLMQVACWAYGNNPAEFGLTPGSGLGGAGFMEGAKAIQYRSLIGPLTKFIGALLTEVVQDKLGHPELKMTPKNYKSMEEQTAQSSVDSANISAGVYTVAYVQDRDGIPPEYRPQAQGGAQQTTVPVPVPEQYAAYMKRAIAADLDLWHNKAQRALKKGWDAPVLFKSDVIPPATIAALSEAVRAARSEEDLRTAFAGQADLIVGRLAKGDAREDLLVKAADPLRAGAETELIKELESYFVGLQLRIEAEASRLREE